MAEASLAQFVISIDLEMSWGAVHRGRPHDGSPYADERQVVELVLELMEKHDIVATWAIVGHLFLDECRRTDGRTHPEVIRPQYSWHEDDWYSLDPGRSVDRDPTWYGSDLVEAIVSSRVPHEIASHSFGHLIVGDPECSAEAFRSDLHACRSVADLHGVDLKSFVFPRNKVGHLDVLAEAGYTSFRSPTPDRFPGRSSRRRRIESALDTVWPRASNTFGVSQPGSLVAIPHTYMFDPGSRTARRVGTLAWSALMRRRLRHAVRTGSLFHLWFHTHNLATHPERARSALDQLFRAACLDIDAGRLENLTMGSIADRWLRRSDP